MSSKPTTSASMPDCLPKDFFDSDKRSKKVQEDELAKELEQFERDMAALEAESQQNIKDEFDKLQDDKNIDEIDLQLDQWKRLLELEKKAEQLQNKTSCESVKKKLKKSDESSSLKLPLAQDEDIGLENDDNFEDKLFNWRAKGL